MMKIDWGVHPPWAKAGLALFLTGSVLEVWIWTHLGELSIVLLCVAPLMFGLGGGILCAQWYDTKKLRRAAREWADAHPGEDPDPEPVPPTRGEQLVRRPRLPVPPEDDPNWASYTKSWVDKPEKPTDESGGMGDHD
jgi:hypothetical protein